MVFYIFSVIASVILFAVIVFMPNSLNFALEFKEMLIDETLSNRSKIQKIENFDEICIGHNLLKKEEITMMKLLS
jgi:hypothetical protein